MNSNPSSNWKAGVNAKFDGASLKEIKAIMGTVVDPEWVIRLPEKEFKPSDAALPISFMQEPTGQNAKASLDTLETSLIVVRAGLMALPRRSMIVLVLCLTVQ